MWNLKYGTNEHMYETKQTKRRLTDIENKPVVAKGKGRERIGSLGLAAVNYYIQGG